MIPLKKTNCKNRKEIFLRVTVDKNENEIEVEFRIRFAFIK